jgi:hypothetical protein
MRRRIGIDNGQTKKSLRGAHGLDACNAVTRVPCAHVDADDHHRPIRSAIVNQKLTLGRAPSILWCKLLNTASKADALAFFEEARCAH